MHARVEEEEEVENLEEGKEVPSREVQVRTRPNLPASITSLTLYSPGICCTNSKVLKQT